MTASRHIKTPTMTVPLVQEEGAFQKGLKLKKKLTRVLLSDVSCAPHCLHSQWALLHVHCEGHRLKGLSSWSGTE